MRKNDNVFVKLQIEKDRNSGELALNVHFDADTPNFYTDKNVISWFPTIEEMNFVNEAFEMISNHKHERKNNEEIGTYTENKTEDHSETSNEEEVVASKPKKVEEGTEETSTLSDSEEKELNEWFV